MTLTELNAYFHNKRKDDLPTLGNGHVSETIDYPKPWANPRILSQTATYQIVRNLKLPVELEATYHQAPVKDIIVYANSFEKYLSIHNKGHIHIYSYASGIKNTQLAASEDIQFFFLLTETKAVGISRTGSIRYWKDINVNQSICYQLSLFIHDEQITAVEKKGTTQLLLGSSTGEIYNLTIYLDQITVSTIYIHAGILSFMSGLIRAQLPCMSQVEKPYNAQRILNLKVFENTFYTVDKKYVSLWSMAHREHVELIARIDIGSKITTNIIRHVPSDIPETDIKSEIINACIIRENEIIILASYSIPDLDDYVQYALITFVLDPKSSTAHAKHTASVPYTALPTSLKSTPQISATNALAFISFDVTVIAVSIDKICVFEEAMVLKEDYVLYTEVHSNLSNDIDTAIIYTMGSGIIEFQIDIAKIHLSMRSRNLNFLVAEDPEKRTDILKFKLKEAVIYGASDQSPLAFPLRLEQANVGIAAMDISTEILELESDVLPSRDNPNFFIESRYVFEKRIMIVLKENNFMNQISLDDRKLLMQRAETYCISSALWQFYRERSEDLASQSYWNSILSNMISRPNSDMKTLLVDYVFRTIDFIGKVCSDVLKAGDDISKLMHIFKSTNALLLRMLAEAKRFEKNYATAYGVNVSTITYPSSVQLGCMVFPLFKLNVKFFVIVKNDTGNMISDSPDMIEQDLIRLAYLSLRVASKEKIVSELDDVKAELEFKNVRKSVIEELCKSGLYEIAINVAQDYNDIPALIVTINTSNLFLQDIQDKNSQFIDQFGDIYFHCLLKFLDANGAGKENAPIMMELLTRYPLYAKQFLEKNELSVSWIYYLRQKDYGRSLTSLEACLHNVTNQDQLTQYQSWKQILIAALQQ